MKKILLIPLIGLFSLLFVACDNSSAEDNNTSDTFRETVIAALASAPVSTDLHATNDVPSAQIHRHIFETLVFQDTDMTLNPGLAESWTQINEHVWEFNLRQGVYFHNGDPFTAEDVAFTFNRAAIAAPISPILGNIDPQTIEVIDTYTVRIGTFEPFAPFLANLAHAAAGIMNERAINEAGENVGRQPVGTGPFKLVEWVESDRIVLERFADYHGLNPLRPTPAINEIIIRQIPDASVRAIELETGAIDIDLNPIPENFDRLRNTGHLTVNYVPGLRTEYIGLNNNHPYLADKRVRQAINYAIDIEAIVEAIFNGHGSVGGSVISANIWGHNPDVEPFPFNLERAKELMAEAGLEDGFSANIYANSERQDRVQVVTIIANQLAALNINLEIIQMDWPSFLTYLDGNDEAAMFALGWTAVTGDADIALFPLFHSSQAGTSGNRTNFQNERVDELLEIGRKNADPAIRLDAYLEAQEIIREYAPWVNILQEYTTVAHSNAITNFVVDPTGSYYLGNLLITQ